MVEAFPVGRRLAFDAAKGRLWVVCRHCQRWNLTPLEERWEAVETCEELFRSTRVRTSTDNIGLARHAEGLELVRIGEPLRPEFAAWRYGDQFGRRRRNRIIKVTAVGAAVIGASVLTPSLGMVGFAGSLVGGAPALIIQIWDQRKQVARFTHSDGHRRELVGPAVRDATRVVPADDEFGFRVETHLGKHLRLGEGRFWADKREWFEGEDARRAMNAILYLVNFGGGWSPEVADAVSRIEDHGHPRRFLNATVAEQQRYASKGTPGWIHKMPKPTRLALEMAVHEEDERRALEGELWRLERAWRDAEEIATIADNLLLPESVRETEAGLRAAEGDEPEVPAASED